MTTTRPHLKRTKLLSVAMVLIALAGILISLCTPAMAGGFRGFGFAPNTYKSGYAYGNGVYFAPYQFTVYEQASEKSSVVGEFRWGRSTNGNHVDVFSGTGEHHTRRADHVFFCFYPDLDVAMLAVTGDDDNGWLEVVYDQPHQKTGWVKIQSSEVAALSNTGDSAQSSSQGTASSTTRQSGIPEHFGVYQTWQEFMKLNAKASGVYWLSGVDQYSRSIRQSDADDAKLLPITIIRNLKVKHIRGNWMLVEVLDFERNTPIGWVRWRDDEGNLMVFPNLSGQHMPIVTTAY